MSRLIRRERKAVVAKRRADHVDRRFWNGDLAGELRGGQVPEILPACHRFFDLIRPHADPGYAPMERQVVLVVWILWERLELRIDAVHVLDASRVDLL